MINLTESALLLHAEWALRVSMARVTKQVALRLARLAAKARAQGRVAKQPPSFFLNVRNMGLTISDLGDPDQAWRALILAEQICKAAEAGDQPGLQPFWDLYVEVVDQGSWSDVRRLA